VGENGPFKGQTFFGSSPYSYLFALISSILTPLPILLLLSLFEIFRFRLFQLEMGFNPVAVSLRQYNTQIHKSHTQYTQHIPTSTHIIQNSTTKTNKENKSVHKATQTVKGMFFLTLCTSLDCMFILADELNTRPIVRSFRSVVLNPFCSRASRCNFS
jgi:hypothetical protein